MIQFVDSIEELKKKVEKLGINADIEQIHNLDFPFFDKQKKFILVSLPSYNEKQQQNIVLVAKKNIIIHSHVELVEYEKQFKDLLSRPHGESTVLIFLLLKAVLKNYSEEFQRIRANMNLLDMNPIIDDIELAGRALRRLTDRCEELMRFIMNLKERNIEEFDTSLISFDYEMLHTETRYWLERCRSHIYRVASLRTKSEMQSNKELNATMGRLTVIMTFLTIVSIVVSVPGTVGAIFGIPALSDAYFRPHTLLLVLVLIMTTLLSIVLGFAYWKSLNLRSPGR
jgi:hypothetical protein